MGWTWSHHLKIVIARVRRGPVWQDYRSRLIGALQKLGKVSSGDSARRTSSYIRMNSEAANSTSPLPPHARFLKPRRLRDGIGIISGPSTAPPPGQKPALQTSWEYAGPLIAPFRCGASRPENRVQAKSKLPQKKCTGLHLPMNRARNCSITLEVETRIRHHRWAYSGS